MLTPLFNGCCFETKSFGFAVLAKISTYGEIELLNALVEVRGTALGILATQ